MMWGIGFALLYLLVGAVLVKLIQLYDLSEEGIEDESDFLKCMAVWPVILCISLFECVGRLWKRFFNCSPLDWLFNLGKKK